jgi:hypothetical protein
LSRASYTGHISAAFLTDASQQRTTIGEQKRRDCSEKAQGKENGAALNLEAVFHRNT